ARRGVARVPPGDGEGPVGGDGDRRRALLRRGRICVQADARRVEAQSSVRGIDVVDVRPIRGRTGVRPHRVDEVRVHRIDRDGRLRLAVRRDVDVHAYVRG